MAKSFMLGLTIIVYKGRRKCCHCAAARVAMCSVLLQIKQTHPLCGWVLCLLSAVRLKKNNCTIGRKNNEVRMNWCSLFPKLEDGDM